MKKIFALIIVTPFLTILLFCGVLSPIAVAADDSPVFAVEPSPIIPPSSVMTVSSSAIVLTRFDDVNRTDAVAFALGTSQDELSEWFSDVIPTFTGYDDQDNFYQLLSNSWSFDYVDLLTPGLYYIFTEPDLKEDYILEDGVFLTQQLCTISLQIPGKPSIDSCVFEDGFLRFPWMLSYEQKEQLDEFTIWIRQDRGNWQQLSEGFIFSAEYFYLSQQIIENDITYDIMVEYPGGKASTSLLLSDGDLSIFDYIGGDRDGGDVDGGGPLTGMQPAPTPTQAPSPPQNDDNLHNNGNINNNDSSNNNGSNNSNPNNSPNNDNGLSSDTSISVQDNDTPDSYKTPVEVVPTLEDLQNETSVSNEALIKLVEQSFVPNKIQDKPKDQSSNPNETQEKPKKQFSVPYVLIEKQVVQLEKVQPKHTLTLDSIEEVLNLIPDNTVDSPNVPIEIQESATIVSESYSPTQTEISALRLFDLCAEEKSVVFGSGDLTVSIPSQLLLALNLSDLDTLSVRLVQAENNQIMFTVEVSGKSIQLLSGSVLRLRYTPLSENAEITVQNELGEAIAGASFDGEFLRFTADKTGTYTVMESSLTPDTQKSVFPLFPLIPFSVALILATGGFTLVKRKRHE